MISKEKYDSLTKKINYLTWFMHHNVSRQQHERWLSGVFYNLVGYYPNFRDPKTFNEKICWLRLNCCTEGVIRAVDKVDFKGYVEEKIGKDFAVKTYGVYDDPLDVEFDDLPERFVLKSSLSSGSNNILLVDCKNDLDINDARYQMSEWLQPWNSCSRSFSVWYKDLKPRIIAEEMLAESGDDLLDYKFLCFNGEPKLLFVVSDRFGGKFFNFYDLEWNFLPFERLFKNAPYLHDKPSRFDEMLAIAREISKEFLFVRVDFYQVGEEIKLGELTFSPGGGLEPFSPVEWDYRLGEMLNLP